VLLKQKRREIRAVTLKIDIDMENMFKEGETVYARAHPEVELTVRRYVSRIYYCKVASDTSLKDQVFFERELVSK
jgi:hypothetical protein